MSKGARRHHHPGSIRVASRQLSDETIRNIALIDPLFSQLRIKGEVRCNKRCGSYRNGRCTATGRPALLDLPCKAIEITKTSTERE